MLTRIVRMVFIPEYVPEFLHLFKENSPSIRSFEGCRHLELWRDEKFEHIFYTYSKWLDKEHLEAYRKSALFEGIWKQTRKGFADRPQAWSTLSEQVVEPKSN